MKRQLLISIGLFIVFFMAILLSSAFFAIFNDDFYLKECSKLGTDCGKTLNIVDYLKNNAELSSEFNEREISHMKDVKSLTYNIVAIYVITLVILVAVILLTFFYNRKRFKEFLSLMLIYGGFFSLAFLIVILILAKLNFDFLFDIFHKIFFEKDTYLFSGNDLLIRLFPGNFFYDISFLIFSTALIASAAAVLVGFIIRKFK